MFARFQRVVRVVAGGSSATYDQLEVSLAICTTVGAVVVMQDSNPGRGCGATALDMRPDVDGIQRSRACDSLLRFQHADGAANGDVKVDHTGDSKPQTVGRTGGVDGDVGERCKRLVPVGYVDVPVSYLATAGGREEAAVDGSDNAQPSLPGGEL